MYRFRPSNDEEIELFNNCREVVYQSIHEFDITVNKYPLFLFKKVLFLDIDDIMRDDLHEMLCRILLSYRKSHMELHKKFRVKSHYRDVICKRLYFIRNPVKYKMVYDNPRHIRKNISQCGCDRCCNTNIRNKRKTVHILDDFSIIPHSN